MGAGPEEDAGHTRLLQATEQARVVRDDDRPHPGGGLDNPVARPPLGIEETEAGREPESGLRLLRGLREAPELVEDGRGDVQLVVADEAAELRLEVQTELEREEEGVRVGQAGLTGPHEEL